jgi:hypothetical protein
MRGGLRLGVAALAVLSALVTTQVAAADDSGGSEAVPLTGEVLLASETPGPGTSEVSGTCTPFGGTFEFTVTGEAIGPYAGTFVEHGTFTLGPAGFPLEAFEATFTITSMAGTVIGMKTLEGVEPDGFGLCAPLLGDDAVDLQVPVRYTATITTETGTATDSGTSVVTYGDTQIRGVANGFNFDETFESTSFSADDDDDDDDEGGGDD